MATILIAVVIIAAAAAVGTAAAFHRRISGEIDALMADARQPNAPIVSEQCVSELPPPVQRWLRYSGAVGQTTPRTVRLRQDGEFSLGRGWMPFTADQYFTTDPPGFIWRATFQMAPLVAVVGRDLYRAGVASIDMRIASLIPVARKSGGGLNQGDLLRFLGEMQWFPNAALSKYITWDSIDATTARAMMQYGGVAGSMTFRFGANGRLLEEVATRYNDARGRNETWVNRNDSDREFGAIRVPASGEARWEYETGPFPYIRWTIKNLEQDHPVRSAN